MAQTLAQLVRAKHPGAYDDLSDEQLEKAVKAKYQGVYDDLPTTTATPDDDRSMLTKAADVVADLGIGAAKGAVNTVSGLGAMARKIPGVSQLDRVMTPIQVNTTPTNTAQKIGMGGEQIGEFFIPIAGVAGKTAKAAEVAKSGILTLAQGGSPVAAGASAALTAVMPGASAVSRASSALQGSAEKTMAQALGATKEGMKAEAAKLAPEMLERGVKGTRQTMLAQAREMTSQVGAQLDDAYKAAAAAGATVDGQAIAGTIATSRGAFFVPDATGKLVVIPGAERLIRKMDQLEKFVVSLGPDIPVDRAAAIKRTWDHIISKAGLFGQKAGASATDSADAWALREASGAFRNLLNQNADIAALNAEVGFWTGLKKVLTATEARTQAQSGGLVSAIGGSVGAGSGFASGDSMSDRMSKALLGGFAGRQIIRGMQSPWWRTTASAPAKKAIADALASGNVGQLTSAVARIGAAMPSQVSQAVTR